MLDQIAEMLKRKQTMDQQNVAAMSMVPYDKWVADAVELLLMLASEAAARR